MNKVLDPQLVTYTAIFEPAEEGGYVVSVPALPGCSTQGETFEEAQLMIRDAIQGYLETLAEERFDIPPADDHAITTQVSVPIPAT